MISNKYFVVLLFFIISHICFAEEGDIPTIKSGGLDNEIIQLKQSNKVYEKVIKNLIKRIENLEDSVADKRINNNDEKIKAKNDELINPEIRKRIEKESEENSNLIKAAFEQRLSKEGGTLLGQYQLIYEPSLSFAHSSYDKIVVDGFTVYPVLVVGDIVSEKVKRDIITNNHSFRLGLGNDMQMDVVIPLGYQKEDSFRGDGEFNTKKTSGIGDVSIGLSHQLIKSHSDWPDTVIAFNWKTTTGDDPYREVSNDKLALGTGFNTYGVSVTSMANSDPIVLFGGYSLNYTDERFKDIGNVKPGISHGLNLGMALALNFDTSLSFNFQFTYTDKTKINGVKINGTNITTSTFAIGLSKANGDSHAVDIDLGIGLTSDSPDFQLTVSMPFNFSL